MKENIYIDLDEDIQSVVGKIQEAGASNLDLIVPTGARVLQNIVDAHLLKEAGDENGKKMVVVTSDLMGKIFAERAGLTVAGSTGSLRTSQAIYGGNEVMATPVASTGRINDIVVRRKVGPTTLAAAKKAAINKTPAKSAGKLSPASKSTAKFSTKKTAGAIPESSKRKGEIGASFLKSYREERAQTNVFNELRKINRRPKFGFNLNFRPNTFTIIWAVVAVAVLVSVFVFAKALPRGEVVIYPARESKSENIEIMISSQDARADLAKGIIPGELLVSEKSESGDFPATGEKNTSEKAKGEITIFNNYSTQPQAFVPSRFQSDIGKIFWTTKSLTVPGMSNGKPGQIKTEVVAAEAGEGYSIGPSKFTMPALKGTPRAGKIYAVSDSPMTINKTGGTKMVSNDDLVRAYGDLKERIKPQFDGFKQNLPEGFQLWPEAYNEELADSVVSPEVGQSAENFKATVKMVARAVVFKNNDLDVYINRQIASHLEDDKLLLPDSKEISFLKAPVVDYQKGSILATLHIKYDVANKIDPDSFKNDSLNKNKKEIGDVMRSNGSIERVEVNLWPFWVRTVPSNPDRVKVRIVGL